jgi:RHS repeat-associated protein
VYLFSGEQNDPNLSSYFMRARYFNSSSGRFLTADGRPGSLVQPLTNNAYTYALNNPSNRIDPSGNFSLSEISLASALSASLQGYRDLLTLQTAYDTVQKLTAIVAATQLPNGLFNPSNNSAGLVYDFRASQFSKYPDIGIECRYKPGTNSLLPVFPYCNSIVIRATQPQSNGLTSLNAQLQIEFDPLRIGGFSAGGSYQLYPDSQDKSNPFKVEVALSADYVTERVQLQFVFSFNPFNGSLWAYNPFQGNNRIQIVARSPLITLPDDILILF